jgi:hypothetical protein
MGPEPGVLSMLNFFLGSRLSLLQGAPWIHTIRAGELYATLCHLALTLVDYKQQINLHYIAVVAVISLM